MLKRMLDFKGPSLLLTLAMTSALMPMHSHAAVKKTDNFWHGMYGRSYDYYVPDNVKPNAPLLVVYHGIYANSERLWSTVGDARDLPALAEKNGFVVMWMESSQQLFGAGKSWNAGPCCFPANALHVDDVGYTREAISRLRDKVNGATSIDDTRIYLLGHSNGGAMVHRLALQESDKYAAIVPVSFPVVDNWTWRIPEWWTQSRAVPVLAMHATNDNVVPYYGNQWIPVSTNWFSSAHAGLETWAARNACTDSVSPKIPHPTGVGSYTESHSICRQGVSVNLLTFPKGQHRPWYPDVNGGVDVISDAWNFLSKYRKPGHKSDRLWSGQELGRNQFLTTDDGRFRLDVQGDSNVVLKNANTNSMIWSSGTGGSGADKLVLQQDGNLVLWNDGYWGWKGIFPVYFSPRAVWSSNSAGNGESRMQINDLGQLQIVRNGVPVWSRG
ncbi:MAG: PHB depolymerase family esterase [Fluviicoccus sp.]|uniref:PHB depolymerase family esterase n=1 Tax=Fluviicoccus sp. TaxID=2003552 RepID=UPI00271B1679|nr:PHB depolymerase family esterase [Fluviicoccus sp.]MDO8331147.1 PHB depolymerase family esterase [Fluviicoccus sp.]